MRLYFDLDETKREEKNFWLRWKKAIKPFDFVRNVLLVATNLDWLASLQTNTILYLDSKLLFG